MRRAFLIGVLVALSLTGLSAWSYLGFEQITVTNTAGGIGLTAASINAGSAHPAATRASCRLETAEIRYTIDGTTVTTTVGTIMSINDIVVLTGNDVLQNFRAIRTGGSSGVLDCNYSTP